MKNYTVYFVIKQNHTELLSCHTVNAQNQAEAIKQTKAYVKTTYGKNAFRCTTKAPHVVHGKTVFDGMGYPGIMEVKSV